MNTFERGEQAKRLLDDPILAEAFDDVKEIYLERSLSLPLHEKFHTERALNMMALNVVDAVTSHLRTAVEHGKQAAQHEAAKGLTPKRIPRKF